MKRPVSQLIPISQLLLDTKNPRFPDILGSQQEAIRSMAQAQGSKIVALAEHLVNNGPNPASLSIVMPAGESTYCVLDGNRRITALKLLEEPALAEGVLDDATLRRLNQLAARFWKTPISHLACVVVADRDEADVWIPLIHRGQQQGAGLVEWDGQVAARYDARKSINPGAAALQVLDFVQKHAQLSDMTRERIEKGKFPITNLTRLVNTPYVRSKLGLEIADGSVETVFPEDEVVKGLTRVVEDLGTGRITVSDIKRQQQRIDYVNGLGGHELPDYSKAMDTKFVLDVTPKSGTPKNDQAPVRTLQRETGSRSHLIPSRCNLKVVPPRIRRIYGELRKIDVDEFPNAAAVMLRVFIELSLDYYLDKELKWPEQQIENTVLAHKLEAVAHHFETNGVMTRAQLVPIRKAASGQTVLVASVKTLHSYVHNRHFSPIPSELKVAWDDLQPFMENVWPA